MPASQAASELGVSRSRLYQIYSDYLRAVPGGLLDQWQPGVSGGSRRNVISKKAEALLRKLLSADPPCSYRFATSELLRRLALRIDSATVRRFAIANSLCPSKPLHRPSKPPFVAGNARIPALSGNSMPPLTSGCLLSSKTSPCSTSSTIVPDSLPVPAFMPGRPSWPTWTSCLALSCSTACLWPSMSIITASFSPLCRRPLPNSEPPSDFMAWPCVMLRPLRPKARSSVSISSGKNVSRLFSPQRTSLASPAPIPSSTFSASITTPRKSTANCA